MHEIFVTYIKKPTIIHPIIIIIPVIVLIIKILVMIKLYIYISIFTLFIFKLIKFVYSPLVNLRQNC